jgi:hypothetical protein
MKALEAVTNLMLAVVVTFVVVSVVGLCAHLLVEVFLLGWRLVG